MAFFWSSPDAPYRCPNSATASGRPHTRSQRPAVALRVSLRLQKLQGLLHECFVILKYAPVPGVVVKYKFGVREAAREIDRVAARHHLVVIAVRHQDRVADARQIVRGLMRPRAYRLQLSDEGGDRDRRVAILGPLFQSAEKVTGRAAAIRSPGEEEIVLRVPERQRALGHVAERDRRDLVDARAPGRTGSARITFRTSRGSSCAITCEIKPPSEKPRRATCSKPNARMNATASCAMAATEFGVAPSDAPTPRLSKAITRRLDAMPSTTRGSHLSNSAAR